MERPWDNSRRAQTGLQRQGHSKDKLGSERGGPHWANAREVLSSEPTIDPADKLFQGLDLLLDPWLRKGVIILQRTQRLG